MRSSRAVVTLLALSVLCAVLAPQGMAAPSSPAGNGAMSVLRGWPCAGCLVELPAGYNPGRPSALVVALHGDEGAPGSIASLMWPVTARQNVILFAPQCPTVLGCRLSDGAGSTNSWWGWLQYSRTYDDSWLGRQITRVEARFAVDRAREYALGWSGGADYLGWYALRDGSRFAAVAFVAGGVPYVQSCPSTHLAAYFLLGLADPRYQSGQPLAVRSVFKSCGDQTAVVTLPGADHQATMLALETRGLASNVLSWLLQHRRSPARR